MPAVIVALPAESLRCSPITEGWSLGGLNSRIFNIRCGHTSSESRALSLGKPSPPATRTRTPSLPFPLPLLIVILLLTLRRLTPRRSRRPCLLGRVGEGVGSALLQPTDVLASGSQRASVACLERRIRSFSIRCTSVFFQISGKWFLPSSRVASFFRT